MKNIFHSSKPEKYSITSCRGHAFSHKETKEAKESDKNQALREGRIGLKRLVQ